MYRKRGEAEPTLLSSLRCFARFLASGGPAVPPLLILPKDAGERGVSGAGAKEGALREYSVGGPRGGRPRARVRGSLGMG